MSAHDSGDCGWNCPRCIDESAREASHDLTAERECRRCGATDFDGEITTRYCVDEGVVVVARPGLETDTIYVNPDGSAFWTPDGVGCYFYDTEEQAFDEAGADSDWETVHLDREFVQ